MPQVLGLGADGDAFGWGDGCLTASWLGSRRPDWWSTVWSTVQPVQRKLEAAVRCNGEQGHLVSQVASCAAPCQPRYLMKIIRRHYISKYFIIHLFFLYFVVFPHSPFKMGIESNQHIDKRSKWTSQKCLRCLWIHPFCSVSFQASLCPQQ